MSDLDIKKREPVQIDPVPVAPPEKNPEEIHRGRVESLLVQIEANTKSLVGQVTHAVGIQGPMPHVTVQALPAALPAARDATPKPVEVAVPSPTPKPSVPAAVEGKGVRESKAPGVTLGEPSRERGDGSRKRVKPTGQPSDTPTIQQTDKPTAQQINKPALPKQKAGVGTPPSEKNSAAPPAVEVVKPTVQPANHQTDKPTPRPISAPVQVAPTSADALSDSKAKAEEKAGQEEQRRGIGEAVASALKTGMGGAKSALGGVVSGDSKAAELAGSATLGPIWGAIEEVRDAASNLGLGDKLQSLKDRFGKGTAEEGDPASADVPPPTKIPSILPPNVKRDASGKLRDATGRFLSKREVKALKLEETQTTLAEAQVAGTESMTKKLDKVIEAIDANGNKMQLMQSDKGGGLLEAFDGGDGGGGGGGKKGRKGRGKGRGKRGGFKMGKKNGRLGKMLSRVPGMGKAGKAMGAITRMGGGLTGKLGGGLMGKLGGKVLGKGLAKGGGKAMGKGLLKKIPGIGALAGLGFGAQRMMGGDMTGGLMEVASGIASTVPGVGTAASTAIDAALMAKDIMDPTEEKRPQGLGAPGAFDVQPPGPSQKPGPAQKPSPAPPVEVVSPQKIREFKMAQGEVSSAAPVAISTPVQPMATPVAAEKQPQRQAAPSKGPHAPRGAGGGESNAALMRLVQGMESDRQERKRSSPGAEKNDLDLGFPAMDPLLLLHTKDLV